MKRDRHVCFDIETTGLSADDRIVSYCLMMGRDDTVGMCCDCTEVEMLEQLSVDVENVMGGKILVTYNGENWAGGFDIPFLRTRYTILDMMDMYPFRGIKHIDLMPIFQKKFNTAIYKEASLEDLSAAQCKEMMHICAQKPLSTKAENIRALESVGYKISDVNDRVDPKIVNKFGLKHCYHLLFGGEVGMTGEDVPDLWERGEYARIASYNKGDCVMTMKLLGVCLSSVPDYDIRYFVL